MKEIDAGHEYELMRLDGEGVERLVFVKREGLKYPGNVGSHAGTNIQEVLRVLIARVEYLNGQVQCAENDEVIRKLRGCIVLLEDRAADRHGRHRYDFNTLRVERVRFCSVCGHVGCYGACRSHGGQR